MMEDPRNLNRIWPRGESGQKNIFFRNRAQDGKSVTLPTGPSISLSYRLDSIKRIFSWFDLASSQARKRRELSCVKETAGAFTENSRDCLRVAKCRKLCHSLNLISGSRWPKAVAKSCGGHIQSIPHVIQGVADFQVYSLDSKRCVMTLGSSGVSSTASTWFWDQDGHSLPE